MTALRPCRHCHRRKVCQKKKATQRAVLALALTLIDFRCSIPFPDFRPGERVSSELDDYRPEGDWSPSRDDYEIRSLKVTLSGTVLRWNERSRKVLVQFDEEIGTADGSKTIRIIGMWPDRLTKLDERPRELCPCGFILTPEGCCDLPDGFVCYESGSDPEGAYAPPPSAITAVKANAMLLTEWEESPPKQVTRTLMVGTSPPGFVAHRVP